MSIVIQRLFARILIIALGIVAVFTGGNTDNINLEIKNDVTTKTEFIEVQVLNYTGKKLTTDEQFTLEKNENEEWVKVDFIEDYKVNDIGIFISNLQTVSFKINILEAFGDYLKEGEYRLTKEFGADVKSDIVFTVFAD